jgi:hypothetical protein
MKLFIVGIALAFVVGTVRADQVAQTSPTTYVSDWGRYRLTVFPQELTGLRPTHLEMMVKAVRDSKSASQAGCEATLERWVGNNYEIIWRKTLTNKISPGSAVVSANGAFATFDDWGSEGYGDNVVVIYSPAGDIVKKYSLKDLITGDEIKALPHTVNTIAWSGLNILNKDILILRVAKPGGDIGSQTFKDIEIRMTDGRVIS